MTYVIADTTHNAAGDTGAGWIERIRQLLATRSQYRTTLAELRQLSVRELEDLGLLGVPLDEVARDTVRGA